MTRTKEQQAAYMREYRARRKHALDVLGETPDTLAAAKAELEARARKQDDAVHAQCDERIAELERQLDDCRHRDRVEVTTMAQQAKGERAFEIVSKPGFLTAPDDDCPTCKHDRHAWGHLKGPCQFPIGRRPCRCEDYDLFAGLE